jgi:hypothetical protein
MVPIPLKALAFDACSVVLECLELHGNTLPSERITFWTDLDRFYERANHRVDDVILTAPWTDDHVATLP